MSSPAIGIAGAPTLRFWNTTNGKKVMMAVSGIVLGGFVAGHLLGNLQVFLGPDAFNSYAENLHKLPALVWGVRSLLIVMVSIHIWSTIQLASRKSKARPVGYTKISPQASTYASRTMYMSGPLLAAFIIYHLMQFTFGVGGTPYNPNDAYGNLIAGFRVPAVSVFYILSMALLCLHLSHGLSSLLQTLGLHHPRYTPRVRVLAMGVALLIFLGFASIPVAIMSRVIPQIF